MGARFGRLRSGRASVHERVSAVACRQPPWTLPSGPEGLEGVGRGGLAGIVSTRLSRCQTGLKLELTMTPTEPSRPDLALVKAAARAGFELWWPPEDQESYGLLALTEAQWERLNSGNVLPTVDVGVDGLRVPQEVRDGRYLVFSDDRVYDGLFSDEAGASEEVGSPPPIPRASVGMARLLGSFLLAECSEQSVRSLAGMSAYEFLPLFVESEVLGLREVTFPQTQYRDLDRHGSHLGACFPCECDYYGCGSVACWKENGRVLLWLATSSGCVTSVAFYPSVSCGRDLEYPVTPGYSPWESRLTR